MVAGVGGLAAGLVVAEVAQSLADVFLLRLAVVDLLFLLEEVDWD